MIHVALNGCGRVGQALLQFFKSKDNGKITVTYIGRSRQQMFSAEGMKLSELELSDCPWSEGTPPSVEEILSKVPVDVWFELTPTDLDQKSQVHTRLQELLRRGVHVISANKGPILHDYSSLKQSADEHHVKIGLSAVMGAALPSFAVGYYGTLGSDILSMEGILNGTSNFILSLMEAGSSFEEALQKAMDTGIAEPNWAYDVDGIDSAVKMAILASVITGSNIAPDLDQVFGLRSIDPAEFSEALEKHQRYKLVARYENGLVTVSPKLYQANDIFYHISGAHKALKISTSTLSDMTVAGGESNLRGVSASMYRDLCWIFPDLLK